MRPAALLLLVPSLLSAQVVRPGQPDHPLPPDPSRRGYVIGLTAFTGGLWQPSGIEAGLVRAVGSTSGSNLYAVLRLGSFVQDQAVLIGGTQGFYTWLAAGYRRPFTTVALVGTERDPSFIRGVFLYEAGLSADFNSPMPQGPVRGTLALLMGFSYGNMTPVDEGVTVAVGPTWFIGESARLHMQVSVRFQYPKRSGRR